MNRVLSIICLFMLSQLVYAGTALSRDIADSRPLEKVFYVATNGCDEWSGTLSTPALSGSDGPFATLQRARNAIRQLRRNGSKDAFTVLVRGGVYTLRETLTFGPEDSGTESAPTVFKAFGSEHPVLSGSEKIKKLEPYKGKIYRANLAGTTISHFFRQLFIDGKRQVLARYPNLDKQNPVTGGFLYVAGPVKEASKGEFRYKGALARKWEHPEDAEVFIFPGPNYTSDTLRTLKVDAENQIVRLWQDASYPITAGNRFYFQNILEELDSPGEWYFDRRDRILYLWPPAEASLESVSVPVVDSILEIKAKKYFDRYNIAPAYIKLEGFTLEDCEGSAVVITGANNIAVNRCTVRNAGKHGIEINDGFKITAIGNDIYEVGANGILVSGGNRKTLTPGENRIANNYIHHIGVFSKTGSGIECRGVGNVISHNLIHSTPRVGIWFDGNDHLIEYNHIHHVNQETQDSGMIYSSQIDWTKRGNVVQFNYLHDSGGYGRNSVADAWQTPFETYGIYMDDWTSGTNVYGNIISKTANAGIFIHSGRDNIVENNVIIEGGRLGQMVYSGWPVTHPTAKQWLPKMYSKIKGMGYTKYPLLSTIKDVQTGASMSGNRFVRNIVYYLNQSAPLYCIYHHIDLATTVSDYNIIYHAGLPLLVPFTKATAELQWKKWKESGLDRNTIVADPLFSDFRAGSFQLAPASPALKMGFKPIPFDKIGPYQDPMRASWPIKE